MKTMKKISLTALMTAVAVSLLLMPGCNRKKTVKTETEVGEKALTCIEAVEKYMADSLGVFYPPADYCIPFNDYISIDDADESDIKVLGDFWILNYDLSGDTLKTMSGGNHPGRMHVRKTGDGGYEVFDFERVGDGSSYEPEARRIFGDKFEEFSAAYSDDISREAVRKEPVRRFVESKGIPAKMIKDYGWPVIQLFEE